MEVLLTLIDSGIFKSIGAGSAPILLIAVFYLVYKLEKERKETKLDKKEIRETFKELLIEANTAQATKNQAEHEAMQNSISDLEEKINQLTIKVEIINTKLGGNN